MLFRERACGPDEFEPGILSDISGIRLGSCSDVIWGFERLIWQPVLERSCRLRCILFFAESKRRHAWLVSDDSCLLDSIFEEFLETGHNDDVTETCNPLAAPGR